MNLLIVAVAAGGPFARRGLYAALEPSNILFALFRRFLLALAAAFKVAAEIAEECALMA